MNQIMRNRGLWVRQKYPFNTDEGRLPSSITARLRTSRPIWPFVPSFDEATLLSDRNSLAGVRCDRSGTEFGKVLQVLGSGQVNHTASQSNLKSGFGPKGELYLPTLNLTEFSVSFVAPQFGFRVWPSFGRTNGPTAGAVNPC